MIAAFVYFKLLNRDGNLGFQDFIIDKISGKQPEKKSSPISKPISTESIIPKGEKTHTDVLANIVSEPQVVSMPDTTIIAPPEEAYVAPTESTIPDWLKESTSLQSSPTSSEATITGPVSIPEDIVSEENVSVNLPESNKEDNIDNPLLSVTENITPSVSEENIDASSESSMPDWLKGT